MRKESAAAELGRLRVAGLAPSSEGSEEDQLLWARAAEAASRLTHAITEGAADAHGSEMRREAMVGLLQKRAADAAEAVERLGSRPAGLAQSVLTVRQALQVVRGTALTKPQG